MGKINSIFDRIIYLDDESNLVSRLNTIMKDLCDYFRIDEAFKLSDYSQQIRKNVFCVLQIIALCAFLTI